MIHGYRRNVFQGHDDALFFRNRLYSRLGLDIHPKHQLEHLKFPLRLLFLNRQASRYITNINKHVAAIKSGTEHSTNIRVCRGVSVGSVILIIIILVIIIIIIIIIPTKHSSRESTDAVLRYHGGVLLPMYEIYKNSSGVSEIPPLFEVTVDDAIERLSFKEQVQLWAEADVVIGPHGAGLTAIIFSRSYVPLVEVRGSSTYRCTLFRE